MTHDSHHKKAHRTHGDAAAPATWHEVSDALNALGDSITRAAAATVGDDENRRRMRELSDGLAALAMRLGDAAEGVGEGSVAHVVDRAADRPGEPAAEVGSVVAGVVSEVGDFAAGAVRAATGVGEQVAHDVNPAVLSALRAANEKFRAVEAEFEQSVVVVPKPAAAAPRALDGTDGTTADAAQSISSTGSFRAVMGDRVSSFMGGVATAVGARGAASAPDPEPEPDETSIHEWLFPDGAVETELQLDTELEPAPERVHAADPAGVERPHRARASASTDPPAAANSSETVEMPASTDATQSVESPVVVEPAPLSRTAEQLEAVRIAHERFCAERKIAEEAAKASRTRTRTRSERRKGKPARRVAPPSDDDATLW